MGCRLCCPQGLSQRTKGESLIQPPAVQKATEADQPIIKRHRPSPVNCSGPFLGWITILQRVVNNNKICFHTPPDQLTLHTSPALTWRICSPKNTKTAVWAPAEDDGGREGGCGSDFGDGSRMGRLYGRGPGLTCRPSEDMRAPPPVRRRFSSGEGGGRTHALKRSRRRMVPRPLPTYEATSLRNTP